MQVSTRRQGQPADGLGFDLGQFTQEVGFDFRCNVTSNQIEGTEVEVDQPDDGRKLDSDEEQYRRQPHASQENLIVSPVICAGSASCSALA